MAKNGAASGDPVSAGANSPNVGEDVDLQRLTKRLQGEIDEYRSALTASDERVRAIEQALEQTRSELRLVSAALMTMQEIERQRIAAELHDSVGQALNALSFGLGTVIDLTLNGATEQSVDMLQRLSAQVKKTVDEVRNIAMDLRPAILDDLGIVGTLSWFFREFRTIYPHMALKTEVNLDESDVAVALRTPIYRVVQEAINNVVKHADADEIQVALGRKPPHIHLEIKDNGQGIPAERLTPQPGAERSGMGLTGMRSRVEFSGGTFQLHSTPGKGTVVRACWPLHSATVRTKPSAALCSGKAGKH